MHLGASLSNTSKTHIDKRIKACRRAFYPLPSTGLCKGGVSPDTMDHIWNVAVQPVLSYATQSLCLRKSHLQALDRTQSRLLKAALVLSKICKNTPLCQALKIHKISDLINEYTLSLLKSHFNNNSISRKLNLLLSSKKAFFWRHD